MSYYVYYLRTEDGSTARFDTFEQSSRADVEAKALKIRGYVAWVHEVKNG